MDIKLCRLMTSPSNTVFPQKPKPSEWGGLQKELLHTIGNLTLAHWADNSSLSNKPFAEKLTIAQGYKQSVLRLNDRFMEVRVTWMINSCVIKVS